jgi:hypothetical protein
LLLVAVASLGCVHIQLKAAQPTFYEVRETTALSRNSFLHQVTRITDSGLVDFSVMEFPLDDEFLTVSVFNSAVELGLKQPTTALLAAHGAMAGVNGDFFGAAGRYSVPLGLEVIEGHVSVHNDLNREANTSAGLLLTADGAFIEYVRPQVGLVLDGVIMDASPVFGGFDDYGNDVETFFEVGLLNMVTNLDFPSFLTYGYAADTAALDARLGYSYKLVVENNMIINITYETVNVPENGFVVIMNPRTFWENFRLFYIGQSAEIKLWANVDLSAVHTAISGSNRILYNGENVGSRWGRQPRTLLGLGFDFDADGYVYDEANKLILMTIDGRGDSIGATLAEAAALMLEFGAYHAINLDGGGSATMAARLPGLSGLSVLNNPSEGRQRDVINAVGVVNSAPVGALSSIALLGGGVNVPVGLPAAFSIIGFDDYMNVVYACLDEAEITVHNGELLMADALTAEFFPTATGEVVIEVRRGGLVAQTRFNAIVIAEITPFGENFIGRDNYGRSAFINREFVQFIEHSEFITAAIHNARFYISTQQNNEEPAVIPQNTIAADSMRRWFGSDELDSDLLFYGEVGEYNAFSVGNTFGDIFVIEINAAGGGFMAADSSAWGRISADLKSTDKDTIVIHTNLSPLYFINQTEFGIFHSIMKELADLGRNVFVVSVNGEYNWAYLRYGVRYVNLANYFYSDDYDEYRQIQTLGILRLRLERNSVYYGLETMEIIHYEPETETGTAE